MSGRNRQASHRLNLYWDARFREDAFRTPNTGSKNYTTQKSESLPFFRNNFQYLIYHFFTVPIDISAPVKAMTIDARLKPNASKEIDKKKVHLPNSIFTISKNPTSDAVF